MIIAGVLDVILWILFVLVVIGAIVGVMAFLGLRKLWRFVAGAFDEDGRPGPGNPPLSRSRPLPPPRTTPDT
jgi:hypothetical protein